MFADTESNDLIPITIDNETIDSITKFITEKGANGLEKFTQEQLDRWKTCTLNIAITGNSGVGKSTLINTIRSLRPYDNGAAAVSVIECTRNPTPYIHPENENLTLWDLPGVGTKRCPQNTYVKDMDFERYDFFLIINRERFTENDIWLAREITRMNKGYFFIRTNIDDNLTNCKDDQPESFNEEAILKEIRNNCLSNLPTIGERSPSVYLISGLLENIYRWDFPRLCTDLSTNFPALKRQAFVLAMSPICTDIIRAKVVELRKRIWIVATASAGVAAIPIPFASVVFDLTACIEETNIYRKQLGITEDALLQLSRHHQISFETFSIALEDKIPIKKVADIGKFVLSIPRSLALVLGTQETSRFIPIFGLAIASIASFGTTMYILNTILNDMEQAALKVHEIILNSSSHFD